MSLVLILWLYALGAVALLVVWGRQNLKNGFRRSRAEVSILEEAFLELKELTARISQAPQNPSTPVAVQPPAAESPAEQLLQLGRAIGPAVSPQATGSAAEREMDDTVKRQ